MPRTNFIAGWKVALLASVAFAILFPLLGGISIGYSWRSVGLLALAGAFLGAIAAPDLEPAAFRHAILWQMSFAISGCLVVAFLSKAEPIGYAIAVIVGSLLGYFARFWAKHINVP